MIIYAEIHVFLTVQADGPQVCHRFRGTIAQHRRLQAMRPQSEVQARGPRSAHSGGWAGSLGQEEKNTSLALKNE